MRSSWPGTCKCLVAENSLHSGWFILCGTWKQFVLQGFRCLKLIMITVLRTSKHLSGANIWHMFRFPKLQASQPLHDIDNHPYANCGIFKPLSWRSWERVSCKHVTESHQILLSSLKSYAPSTVWNHNALLSKYLHKSVRKACITLDFNTCPYPKLGTAKTMTERLLVSPSRNSFLRELRAISHIRQDFSNSTQSSVKNTNAGPLPLAAYLFAKQAIQRGC